MMKPFEKYLRLLLDLQALTEEASDGPEGDVIRDQMDVVWAEVSPGEEKLLDDVSEALYNMYDPKHDRKDW